MTWFVVLFLVLLVLLVVLASVKVERGLMFTEFHLGRRWTVRLEHDVDDPARAVACSRAEGHDGPCNGWPCDSRQRELRAALERAEGPLGHHPVIVNGQAHVVRGVDWGKGDHGLAVEFDRDGRVARILGAPLE